MYIKVGDLLRFVSIDSIYGKVGYIYHIDASYTKVKWVRKHLPIINDTYHNRELEHNIRTGHYIHIPTK